MTYTVITPKYDNTYQIGDVLEYSLGDYKFTRIVLNNYGYKYRLSCTADETTRHFQTHHLKGKCHKSVFWNAERIKSNGYRVKEDI